MAANFQARLNQVFNTQPFSDTKIRCRGTTFYAHKVIICVPGSFFDLPQIHGCKEIEGVIELPDDHPDVVFAVLQSLYGMKYDVSCNFASAAAFHAEIYARSEYLGLPALKNEARGNFEDIARSGGADGAKQCLLAAKTVYNLNKIRNTDRGLKDIVVSVVTKYKKLVVDDDAESQRILAEVPDLMFDLLVPQASSS